jgi:hypothetical protein
MEGMGAKRRNAQGAGSGRRLPKKRTDGPMAETTRGEGDLDEALGKLSGGKKERLSGAKLLQGIKSPDSFEPLLAAAEKEKDKEVRLEMLRALNLTSDAGEFSRPEDTVQRLEALLFSETEPEVAREAASSLYYFHHVGKVESFEYFNALYDRAMEELGEKHTVTVAIANATAYHFGPDMY